MTTEEVLQDLIVRITTGIDSLLDAAEITESYGQSMRLHYKIDGMVVARSYVWEAQAFERERG